MKTICGNPWFNMKIRGRQRIIFKITWHEACGEYVVCFYYWYPEHKRGSGRSRGCWGRYSEDKLNRLLRLLVEAEALQQVDTDAM